MSEESSGCTCSSGGVTRTIYACSRGSSVGQISNEAAQQLSKEGFGKFFCLAGVVGNVGALVENRTGI